MEKREEAMEGEILVLLSRRDRIEGMLPSIEKIAQPGMRVVFLIPYPVELWPWFRDHWITTESRRTAIAAGRKIMREYSWEVQKSLAEQKISPAREVLHKKQVEVSVNICMSSMRKTIENHSVDREGRLVFLQAGSHYPPINLMRRILSLFGPFKRPDSLPILLFYPGQ
jgi:hypothetical protein